MSLPDPTLLRAVAQAMADVAPEGWRRITLDVMAADDQVDAGMEVELADGSGGEEDVLLELDGFDAVEDLRKAMYEPDTGTWYLATFTLTDGGEVDASFDYDHAPFGGHADPALLLRDHARYPRSPEELPPWHPARG